MISYLSFPKSSIQYNPVVSSRNEDTFTSILNSHGITNFNCSSISSPCEVIISSCPTSPNSYVLYRTYTDYKYMLKVYLSNLIYCTKSINFYRSVFEFSPLFKKLRSFFNEESFNIKLNRLVDLIGEYFYGNNIKYPSVRLNNFYLLQIVNLLNKEEFDSAIGDIVIDIKANIELEESAVANLEDFKCNTKLHELLYMFGKTVEFSLNSSELEDVSVGNINVDKSLFGLFPLCMVCNNDKLLSAVSFKSELVEFDLFDIIDKLNKFEYNSEVALNDSLSTICNQYCIRKKYVSTLRSLLISNLVDIIIKSRVYSSNVYSYLCSKEAMLCLV